MRKWAVVGAVAVVVVAGVLGFALANVNRWLERNRDWVAARRRGARSRGRVRRGRRVAARRRVGAAHEPARRRRPAVRREPFLQAREVRVALRILPALFRRIEVRYVASTRRPSR
jgi:hypothetical protein